MSEGLSPDTVPQRRLGAIFLANTITTGAMLCGFWAIMQALQGDFWHATWALFFAGVADGLDGRIARLVKGTSAFGEQYDSLADLISFGFAPALIGYQWGLSGLGNLGVGAAFFYLCCTAIRLARFNTLIGEESSRKYFTGIPSPMAAGLAASPIMVREAYFYHGALDVGVYQWVYLAGMVGIGLLMVSPLKFRTLKDIGLTRAGVRLAYISLAAVLALMLIEPPLVIFGLAYTYLAVGLAEGGVLYYREEEKRLAKREARRLKRQRRKEARRIKREEKARLRAVRGGE